MSEWLDLARCHSRYIWMTQLGPGANTSEWFDWPLETIQLDGSTWLPNPIHLNGSTWLPKPIRLNSSTWLELQYRSTFQSSNLIGRVRVNLGC